MKPTKDTLRLLLARHGATTWNSAGRYVGRTDIPLSELGEMQARRLAARLGSESIAAIYTSDLRRAVDTAAVVAAACGLPLYQDSRLREVDFGQWEGLTQSEIRQRFPAQFATWQDDPAVPPPGGENPSDLLARVKSFMQMLRNEHMGETVLVVGHGVMLQAVVFEALALPWKSGWHFYMYNGSISELRITAGKGVMVTLNDTHHLHGA